VGGIQSRAVFTVNLKSGLKDLGVFDLSGESGLRSLPCGGSLNDSFLDQFARASRRLGAQRRKLRGTSGATVVGEGRIRIRDQHVTVHKKVIEKRVAIELGVLSNGVGHVEKERDAQKIGHGLKLSHRR
jgi:hypothetical protein